MNTRLIDVTHSGTRSRTSGNGGPPQPKDHGELSAVSHGYISFYLSKAAELVVKGWKYGARMQWEVNADSGLPVAIHLKPAEMHGRRFSLRSRAHQRPHLALPTKHLGAVRCRVLGCQRVEEISISADEIVIAIPDGYFDVAGPVTREPPEEPES